MNATKRKAVGGYYTTTTAIKKTHLNIAPGCKKRHATLKRCDTVIPGASNTTKLAGNLPDSEVFSRPEFASAGPSRLHGFGRDGANRKAARMTNFMFETSRPPVARSNAASGFQSQLGAKAMTTVNTTTTPKAATLGNSPALSPSSIARQQAIENALTTALYFIRLPSTESGLRAATGRAIRAASMLKQACAESTTSGRA